MRCPCFRKKNKYIYRGLIQKQTQNQKTVQRLQKQNLIRNIEKADEGPERGRQGEKGHTNNTGVTASEAGTDNGSE